MHTKTSSSTPIFDTLKKIEASKPNEHLTSNLLKLCNGLRAQGLTNYANILESKFMQYKTADAFYDVSGETGEDVVNTAHPEGSHTMKGVEGDATIETILDRAKKMQEVIKKEPTGKLAARDALNVARILLAQTVPTQFETVLEDIRNDVAMSVNNIDSLLNQILIIASTAHRTDFGTFSNILSGLIAGPLGIISAALQEYFKTHKSYLEDLKKSLNRAKSTFDKDSSSENVKELKTIIGNIQEEIDQMPSEGNIGPLKTQFDKAAASSQTILDRALDKYSRLQISNAPTTTQTVEDPYFKKIQDLINKVNTTTKLNETGKTTLQNWLKQQANDLNDPQKAATVKQNIDQAETQWTTKGYI